MRIYIPFMSCWRDRMLNGIKSMTCRTKVYGKIGDTFNCFGVSFRLIGIEKVSLLDVSVNFYKNEGCNSPDEYKKVWCELHPYKGFVDSQIVYLHRFERESDVGCCFDCEHCETPIC